MTDDDRKSKIFEDDKAAKPAKKRGGIWGDETGGPGMDVKRDVGKSKKKYIYAGAAALTVIVTTVALARLKPAAPTVDSAVIWTDVVKRGEMLRQVRGPGTLVPEHMQYISALTAGRIEQRHVLPGAVVTPETVLLTMTNPDVQLEALEAERQLAGSQAALVDMQSTLRTQLLNQQGVVATVKAGYQNALRTYEANQELAEKELISELELERTQDQVEEFRTRLEAERERLAVMQGSIGEQLEVQRSQVNRWHQIVEFQRDRLASMTVTAGTEGVVQEIPFEPGQWVQPGTQLARIIQPEVLKAVLRIPEVQAKDVTVGQPASIDTRNSIIPGRVIRIDPAATNGTVSVDVTLLVDELPPGARPDLSVDGTIEVERLEDVLYVGRPAYGQAEQSIGMFKLVEGGDEAVRVTVQIGRTSVNEVEIRGGLDEGDTVILSDMSQWDAYDRVRIR